MSSPGNVIRLGDDFVLCLQTYPTPRREDKYGNASARLWTCRSKDLETWGEPELLRVEGPNVPPERMSRLIDPYLFDDRSRSGAWWCFYKKDGRIAYSSSPDLNTWTPRGVAAIGENPCVIVDGNEYVAFSSPETGIGVARSLDLVAWRDCGLLTLGGQEWDWAKGRLSAGLVLDLRTEPARGKGAAFLPWLTLARG